MNLNFMPRMLLGLLLALPVSAMDEKSPPSPESIKVPSSVVDPKDYGHHAPYLLLTCMDFRLRDEVHEFMEQWAGKDAYDEIVLPGASLAVINDQYPHWGKTFEDVLKLAIKLHGVTNVVMMDHRECGAYKLLKGQENLDTPEKEMHVHMEELTKVKAYLQKNYPSIKIHTLIMGMDGKVETVRTDGEPETKKDK